MESNRNIGYLPEELIDEILLRLPVKVLLQFKSVCKEWCALITSPSFVSRHYSHESNQDCLFFRIIQGTDEENQYAHSMYEDDESQNSICLPQIPTEDRARILVGPEHGIFCVMSYDISIGLLNPAMREFKHLPPHPYIPFAFCNPVIGLGLDPCSGDFKVVAFEKFSCRNYAFVYNLTSDSWKEIEPVKKLDIILCAKYVFKYQILNGVHHWLVTFCGGNPFILAFDMRSEKFQEIPIPDALRSAKRLTPLQITAYGDHSIALVSFESGNYIDLWVMGRDGLWSKNLSLSIDTFRGYLWPLCVWKKKKVFFETSDAGLNMYDISTQKVTTVIRRTGSVSMHPNESRHFIYKESLVSVKGERVPW